METNETILTRKAVGLAERKTLGKISDLRVDYDTLGVCHYIVNSASTNSPLVLPFEKALAVGDTFVTVQGRGDFLPMSGEASGIVNDGFKLVGSEVYSKTGNRLGIVASYGFDTVFGKVTELVLDSGATFAAEQFVFFAPEFVFVDDGERTAAEQRGTAPVQDDAEIAEEPSSDERQEAASVPLVLELEADEPSAVEPEEVVEEQPDEADEDAELVAFLLGRMIVEDVASADGEFTASKGTVLTADVVDEARAHDALLLLTMSVDE